ncbi:MAG: AsmA-like C-terminal region-containing protein [Bacteroidota bacterium]
MKKRRLYGIAGAVGIFLILLFLFMLILPSVFGTHISEEIKKRANSFLDTELQFKTAQVSFFDHFPALTFSFGDLRLQGSAPFTDEALVVADELAFGIDVFKLLFSNEIAVNKIVLSKGDIQLRKDRFGRDNYNVYQGRTDTLETEEASETSSTLDIEKLVIKNSRILYEDQSNGITIVTTGFNYGGSGELEDEILELGSQLDVTQIDIVLEGIDYLKGKKLQAKSITVYDTETVAIHLDENNISINDLDMSFEGGLNIFEDGLAYDFLAVTRNSTLSDLVSVLPPEYVSWSEEVDFKGGMDATIYLNGYSGSVPDSLKKEVTSLDLRIEKGEIAHKNADQPVKDLYLSLEGSYEKGGWDVVVDSLGFVFGGEPSGGRLKAMGKQDSLYLRTNFKSKIDLDNLNRTLQLPGLVIAGVLDSQWDAQGVYSPKDSKFPKINGFIDLQNGYVKTSGYPEPITNIQMDARVANPGTTYTESELVVDTLHFAFLDNPFGAKAFFKDFDRPEYFIKAKGLVDFENLNKVISFPLSFSGGSVKADMRLKGKLSGLNLESMEKAYRNENSGTLEIKNVSINADVLNRPFVVQQGTFLFLGEKMAFSDLELRHGRSTASLKGHFRDYLEYALFSKGILRGSMELQSTFVDIAEFLPQEEVLGVPPEGSAEIATSEHPKMEVSGVIPIPQDVDISLQLHIDSLQYNALTLKPLSGVLSVKEGGLLLRNGKLGMVKGAARLDGFYRPINAKEALFSMDLKGKGLDIAEAYETIVLFRELVPASEQASGRISMDYELSGTLDGQMLPILPSLEGGGTVSGEKIRFNGYKLMKSVSKESGFTELDDPDLSGIKIKSTIKDNLLTLERFKFKVPPFRLRTEGQTTLDGDLSLRMRIGLPPFGIIGIPVNITGPSEDFKVKLGRKSPDLEQKDYEEGDYSAEERRRMALLKDSIKGDMSLGEIEGMQQRIQKMQLDSLPSLPVDSLGIQR